MSNIIANEEIMPELLQYNCTVDSIVEKFLFLFNKDQLNTIKSKLQKLTKQLKRPNATNNIARHIIKNV